MMTATVRYPRGKMVIEALSFSMNSKALGDRICAGHAESPASQTQLGTGTFPTFALY